MKKLNKKILISITIILLFTSIIISLIPKENIATWKLNININDEITTNSSILLYPNVLCVQQGGWVISSMKFKAQDKYEIFLDRVEKNGTNLYLDNNDMKWFKGLAYILNQLPYDSFTTSLNKLQDPAQIALWIWITQHNDTGYLSHSNMSNSHKAIIKEIQKVIWHETFATPTTEVNSSEAYIIYQEALAVESGSTVFDSNGIEYGAEALEKNYSATYLTLNPTPSKQSGNTIQNLIIVTAASDTNLVLVPFGFELNKKAPTGANVNGANFQIEIIEGTGATVKATYNETTTNGKINISYTPSATNITAIQVKITETIAPTGYTKLEPFTINLSRDNLTDTTWEIKSPNGNGRTYTSDSNNLIANIKEATDISEIKFIKQIPGGTKISGATFKIELTNVEAPTVYNNLVTNSNGVIEVTGIKPIDTSKTVTIKLSETNAPTGYMNIKDYEFKMVYDKVTGYWKKGSGDSISVTAANNKTKIVTTINEPANIRGLELTKVSMKDGSPVAGAVIQGAKFGIEFQKIKSLKYNEEIQIANASGIINLSNIETNSSGKFNITEIIPVSVDSTVLITITENIAPYGRQILSRPISLQAIYNETTCLWEISIRNPKPQEKIIINNSDSSTTIQAEDYSIIKDININKFNSQDPGTPIRNAKFEARITNVSHIGTIPTGATSNINNTTKVATITNLSTGTLGKFGFQNVRIYDINQPIILTLTEVEAPTGYAMLGGKIQITLKYNKVTGIIEKQSYNVIDGNIELEEFNPASSVKLINDTVNINIGDRSVIRNFETTKVNSQNLNLPMKGAEFEVTIENAKEILQLSNVQYLGNNAIFRTTTDNFGKISVSDIVIKDITKNVKIRLKETKALVGYKIIRDEMEVILSYDKVTGKLTKVSDNTEEIEEFKEVKINEDKVNFDITNIPIMNLGGRVWKDEPLGDKTNVGGVQAPNGLYNEPKTIDINDKLLSEIKISLYKENGVKVKKDVYGTDLMTKTAKDGDKYTYIKHDGSTEEIILKAGQYVFPNIELGYNYYIEFEYDGMTYIEYKEAEIRNGEPYQSYENITSDVISDAKEIDRQAFNNKFEIITGGGVSADLSTSSGESKSLNNENKINLKYNNQNKIDSNGNIIKVEEGTNLRDAKIETKLEGPRFMTAEEALNSSGIKEEFIMKARIIDLLPKDKNWIETWKTDGTINLEDDMLKLDLRIIRTKGRFKFNDRCLFCNNYNKWKENNILI